MKVSRFQVNPFVENTYILWDDVSHEAAIVDPGMMRDIEREMISSFISDNSLTVRYILVTHIHIDHVSSVQWCADTFGAPVCASLADEPLSQQLPEQAMRFGLMKLNLSPIIIDRPLADGETLKLGEEMIEVIAVPGHSPGGLVFYLPVSDLLVAGDTIFQSSIGRTDLYGGSYETLIDSIQQNILTLPPDTMILPGHGDTTTVHDEKLFNPFL